MRASVVDDAPENWIRVVLPYRLEHPLRRSYDDVGTPQAARDSGPVPVQPGRCRGIASVNSVPPAHDVAVRDDNLRDATFESAVAKLAEVQQVWPCLMNDLLKILCGFDNSLL